MAKSPKNPYSAVLGTGERNQVGGPGTPITRSVVKGSDNRTPSVKSPGTNRTPTGRSIGGNW